MSNAQQNKSETQPNQSRDSQIDEVLVDLVSSYVRSGQSADYGTAKAALQKIIDELIISELKDLIKFEKLDITKLTGIEAIKVTDVLQRIDQLSKSKRSE